MITWKLGLIFGVLVAVVALLMWALGLGARDATASEDVRYYILAVPTLALLGGGMVSWNPQMSATLFAIAGAMVIYVFGAGILPLILCAVLVAAALLAFLDL
jgi:hypothetical protein